MARATLKLSAGARRAPHISIALLLTLVLAYVAAAKFGLALAFATKQVTALWPPSGVALVALTRYGVRTWPGIFLGAFLANATHGEPLLTALGIAAGNTLGPVAGAWALRSFAGFDPAFTRLRDVLSLFVIGALGAMTITATNGVAQLALAGITPWSAYFSVWWVWWMGDAMGVLLVSPFLFTWLDQPKIAWRGVRLLEFCALFALLYVASVFVLSTKTNYPVAYTVFPFIIWSSLRFGRRETATAVLLISAIAVYGAVHDHGPFAHGTLDERLILLEVFMAVAALAALSLSAVTTERWQAEAALRHARDELEVRVEERTADLSRANSELAKTNAELERASALVRSSEERFRVLFNDSPISLWEEDFSDAAAYFDGLRSAGIEDLRAHLRDHLDVTREAASRIHVLAVNQASLRIYEAASAEELLARLPETWGTEALERFCDEFAAFLDGKTSLQGEAVVRTLRGRTNHVAYQLNVLPGHERRWSRVVVSLFDLSGQKNAERHLRASLKEKEVLLKEIHHRVKNNLQVISSLLALQRHHVDEPRVRQILSESRARVQSIALVHEKLYQSKDLSSVDFREYLDSLLDAIFHAQNAGERGIRSELDVDQTMLAVDQAVPCGLIVSELITNSLKHAFQGRASGTIYVKLRSSQQGGVVLSVGDDGIGFPKGADPRVTSSLGLELVFALAEQLEARVEIGAPPWASFTFRFQNPDAN